MSQPRTPGSRHTGGEQRPPAPTPQATRQHARGRARADVRTVALGGRHIPYTLRVSHLARRLRLVIKAGTGLEVVVPRGAPASAHERFLREKEQWILATLEKVAREAAAAIPPALADGQRLPFAGGELILSLRTDGPANRFHVRRVDDILTVTIPQPDQELARRALEQWYRRQAAAIFAERLQAANLRYGFTYGRVSIKEQKSRWGSCSKLGNLNFNWRLLLAPLPALDYVVVHELCHLKELNHSSRFWRLVATGCPDYATQRRWLREHGRMLQF